MERLKEGGRQLAAGGTAGMVEVCLMHPLDLMKTRLQLGGGHYSGLADCFRQTVRKEGLLGFYKGILPPILAETPKRATKFFTFEQYKQALEPLGQHQVPVWARLSLAGLMSGITEAFVICPFEAVKVRLQSETNIKLTEQRSAAAMAREIVRTHGLGTGGLYRGLGATLWRHGVWNMFYFGLYHNLKLLCVKAGPNGQQPSSSSPQGSVPLRLLLGFTAGSIASIANIPFDVAKSRIQGPQPESGRVYHTTWQAIGHIYTNEGFAALYRGLLPKVMRLGPGGGIMLVVFETVYEFLAKHT